MSCTAARAVSAAARQTGPRRVLPPDALHRQFTASGDVLFAPTGDTVRSWSVPGFTEAGRLDVARKGLIMRVSPDGRTVITYRPNQLAPPTLWDAASRRGG
ncbi:hypothetical protein [Acrocarpospora sp. B8E8]|uniref:hypothetical protein n=1 Tax=Acrocarpospora sp. B8E8 TaxID=3153572 RepID=UPI00325C5F29